MGARTNSAKPRAEPSAPPARWEPPAFANAPWYLDADDDRCLQDARLERVDEDIAAHRVALTLITRGGGKVTLEYRGVRRHTIPCYACDQGAGEWRRDEFEASAAGRTLHRITWRSEAAGTTAQWRIEAEAIVFIAGPSKRRTARRRR